MTRAADVALQIFQSVLAVVRADRLVQQNVERVGDSLFVQGRHIDLSKFDRVFVAGAGKASAEMGRAVVELVPDRVSGGLLIAKFPSDAGGIRVISGGHPVPDESSLESGRAMLEFAQQLDERDLVLFVLSGGASALMEAPIEGVSLDDLALTNEILLGSGSDISVMNSVRRRISRIKAGGLARAMAPATVVCLVLSDVVGNDLATVGSGPLMAPKTDWECPPHLLDQLPAAVRGVLEYPMWPAETPVIEHFVIGSVTLAIHAAAEAAVALGLAAFPYADPLKGEARVMARQIMRLAERHLEVQKEPFCLIFGGETTVTLRGQGRGGRCQEMAVAAAPRVARHADSAFLAAGTDGQDGPTDAAGGVVDPASCERASIGWRQALVTNDAYAFLESTDGLVRTGPTGTNVNDLALFVSLAGA
jgi:glycerate 2-kinase